jgi:DNA-binding CsgD family transcriptional regulator
LANSRILLGLIAIEQGDNGRARGLVAGALPLYQHSGFPYGIAKALLVLGRIDMDCGDTVGAAARYAESLPIWCQIRSQEGLVDVVVAAGTLAAAAGQVRWASRLLGAAAVLGEALGYVATPQERVRCQRAISTARAALGKEFSSGWDEGGSWSLAKAIDETSECLKSLAAPGCDERTVSPAARLGLTPRELEVLTLIAEGLSDRQVATALFVGQGTVRSHLTNIFGKLEVGSRTAAVASARRLGIV